MMMKLIITAADEKMSYVMDKKVNYDERVMVLLIFRCCLVDWQFEGWDRWLVVCVLLLRMVRDLWVNEGQYQFVDLGMLWNSGCYLNGKDWIVLIFDGRRNFGIVESVGKN
jgi:hypothetical protein